MTKTARSLISALLVAWMWCPTICAAEDFNPQSDAWNGLSYLLHTAKEARVEATTEVDLDFSKLDPNEILVLVAPRVGPGHHIESLRRYLAAGGRLVVADDFRAGYRWLAPFGVELTNSTGPAREHVADMRHLPRFDLRRLGPYLDFFDRRARERPYIVLNHPASLVLRDDLPPKASAQIRGWYADRARGWLAETMGAHRLLAIADSSLFINAMLRRFYGNKQFAANVLRYFCYVGETCRVKIVANLSDVRGTFDRHRWASKPASRDRSDLRGRLRSGAKQLSDILRKQEMSLLWWALIVLGISAPVIGRARTIAPMLPPRTESARRRTRLHQTVAAWLGVRDADYRQPARLLAGHLSTLVEQAAQPVSAGASLDDASDPERSINELLTAGRLSNESAARIRGIVNALRELVGAHSEEVDRQRFTALAAEVEWAEQVLIHTGTEVQPREATSTLRSEAKT